MQNAQLESLTSFTPQQAFVLRDRRHADESEPVALWQLHRAGHDLLCAMVPTTYGYSIALALSGELVIFELERDLERLARKAHRLETRLLARGWMRAGTQ